MTAAKVPGVEARAGKFPGPSLIPELNAIQARLGWLPREELVALGRELRRPLYEIEGLISFYPHFRTDPPAKVAVHGCHDLTCWLAGADAKLAEVAARLDGAADVEFTEVSCLGRCDTAPAVAVNEHPAPLEDTDALVAAARADDLGHAAPTPSGRAQPWPNDPYAAGEERYRVLRSVLTGPRRR
jgi:NADH:ubiquinone oxidoreductase subunit E